jgi:hypothetical protein
MVFLSVFGHGQRGSSHRINGSKLCQALSGSSHLVNGSMFFTSGTDQVMIMVDKVEVTTPLDQVNP